MNDFGLRENKPNQTQSQDPTPKRVGRTKEWPDEAQLLACGTFSANIEHEVFLQHKAVLNNNFFTYPLSAKIAFYSPFKRYHRIIGSGLSGTMQKI